MRPDDKKESLAFHRYVFSTNTNSSSRSQNCRIKLQQRFENDKSDSSDRSVLSILSLNDTRRVFRNGAEKLSRTFSSVRTSLGNLSQRFKSTTRRRQILEEGPVTPNCATPQARLILGRTPTKLYSPFGIESPKNEPVKCDEENAASPSKERWPRKRNLLEDIF